MGAVSHHLVSPFRKDNTTAKWRAKAWCPRWNRLFLREIRCSGLQCIGLYHRDSPRHVYATSSFIPFNLPVLHVSTRTRRLCGAPRPIERSALKGPSLTYPAGRWTNWGFDCKARYDLWVIWISIRTAAYCSAFRIVDPSRKLPSGVEIPGWAWDPRLRVCPSVSFS